MASELKVIWQGDFKQGNGHISVADSTLNQIAYTSVFGQSPQNPLTTPEELLASAHGGCFNLTFSFILAQANIVATSLETTVEVVMENNVIVRSNLDFKANIPGLDKDKFQELAKQAKQMCAIGNALKIEINLKAELLP